MYETDLHALMWNTMFTITLIILYESYNIISAQHYDIREIYIEIS